MPSYNTDGINGYYRKRLKIQGNLVKFYSDNIQNGLKDTPFGDRNDVQEEEEIVNLYPRCFEGDFINERRMSEMTWIIQRRRGTIHKPEQG